MKMPLRPVILACLVGLLAGLLLSSFAPVPTRAACDCPEPLPPREALMASVAVFSGTVTAIDVLDDVGMNKMHFDVGSVWRDPMQYDFSVLSPQDPDDCGVEFELGKQYIVYATRMDIGDLKGALITDRCSRTREPNEDEIRELGHPQPCCWDVVGGGESHFTADSVRTGEYFTLALETYGLMGQSMYSIHPDPHLAEFSPPRSDQGRGQDCWPSEPGRLCRAFSFRALRPGELTVWSSVNDEIEECTDGMGCAHVFRNWNLGSARIYIEENPDFPSPTDFPTPLPTPSVVPTQTPIQLIVLPLLGRRSSVDR